MSDLNINIQDIPNPPMTIPVADPLPDTGHRAIWTLNRKGDVSIGWTPDEDEKMEALIQRKMDQGCRFFQVRPFTSADQPMRDQITKLEDIHGREITLGDEDFEKFFMEGTVGVMGRIRSGLQIVRELFSARGGAREAARTHTWMTRPLVGG